jgi:hypothetical protein
MYSCSDAAEPAHAGIVREAQIKSKLSPTFTRDEFHVNFFTGAI